MRWCWRTMQTPSLSPLGRRRPVAAKSLPPFAPSAVRFPIMPSSASFWKTCPTEAPVRRLRITLGFLLAFYVAEVVAAQQSPVPIAELAQTQSPETPAAASSTAESLLVGPGDLLHITMVRESELDQHIRVRDSGEIVLA